MKKTMKVKVCLFGEGAVGKTSTIKRFVLDCFDDSYITTIGTKISKKSLTIDFPEYDLEVDVIMSVWDIMGQAEYLQILKTTYFHDSNGIIGVVDLTRQITLNNLTNWVKEIRTIIPEAPLIIMGNKNDIPDQHQYTVEDLGKVADELGAIGYFPTSAKTGENVEEVFRVLAKDMAKIMLAHNGMTIDD